ncbi:MAG: deoxyribodipyrimidine photo-lyase [Candidatus Binatia bacterium]
MRERPSLVWLRHDLRLTDNPALHTAVESGGPIIPLFIWAPAEEGAWSPGAASRWWLHQSLLSLDHDLQKRGARLILRCGESLATLQAMIRETNAQAVFWNRRYEPAVVERDRQIKTALRAESVQVKSFSGSCLFEPSMIRNTAGKPFQVFTPFWKSCLSLPEPDTPLGSPESLPSPSQWPQSVPLPQLALEPTLDWAGGIRATWSPGEDGALGQLQRFLAEAVASYAEKRARPDLFQTSRLSPYLHYGEMSPRFVWHAVQTYVGEGSGMGRGGQAYLRQLGWREFAHHLLFHFPHTVEHPLRSEFTEFPWRKNAAELHAWQQGQTGYPLVDAGMRELWTTGWMHNRVRMVVASFLVKHLLLHWREGERWFWDTLVDADLANNTLGWQWVAGCGADAAPYFRIFNPVTQGEKFDPQGQYVCQWVPELGRLPPAWIHKPWEAPQEVLSEAEVKLGSTYPEPIVEHHTARIRALAALAAIKKPSASGASRKKRRS